MPYIPRTSTFDPAEVIVTYAGNILTGFAQNIIVAERATDSWDDDAGADGEVVRWATNDRRGNIVLTFQPTSADNLILSALRIADENGLGVPLPFSMTDRLLGDTVVAASAWTKAPPKMTKTKGVDAKEWILRCGDLNMAHVGVQ